MTKIQKVLFAAAGVSLVVGTQAQAGYANQDLLLNFRNVTTTTDSDVTVDVGNITTFVNTVAAQPGGTADLNSLYNFSAASINTLLGASSSGNVIGLTAAASTGALSSASIWESRQIVTPTGAGGLPTAADANNGTTTSAPTRQTSFETTASTAIKNIGLGAYSSGTVLSGSSANALVVPSANGNSFQTKGQASTGQPGLISFGGSLPVQGNQSSLELQQDGSGNFYSALWSVPNGTGTSGDTLLGYFTFQPSGEVDFSTQFASAVPEPSTYAFVAGLGLLGLVARRQLRALAA